MIPTNGKWISGAAGVVLISIFFPWLLVSCNEQPVAQISGWQIAAGGTLQTQLGPQQMASSVVMFAIPVLAIVTLVMVYQAYTSNSKWRRVGMVAIIAGGVNLVMMILMLISASSQAASQEAGQAFEVRPEFGFWLEIVANLALLFFGYRLRREDFESVTPPLSGVSTE